ncbi:hypothetical protein CkaCkLH20_11815 [Colletotrichum karsti]|uniref:Methyltransferase type 11 domain-containing protein n=1 Tax=Colletotrichum karsti TaxID=1095194 RepID=A0A9P6HTF1_9PEZI|nr:uncharacterized protein CkaCkLH20_11815 [Colletotrichum karsti]KAF9870713.1 hypothetical protein CkaCkLH20_11815 [Colletotrichum karsti]
MSSLVTKPAPAPLTSDINRKPPTADSVAAAPLNAAGDKANLTSFWRTPEAGNIYRHAEHLTGPVTPCLVDHAGLRERLVAAAASSNPNPVRVIDMCCGTGVVSGCVQRMVREMGGREGEKLELVCADSSEAQLGVVREKIEREGWVGVDVALCDIMDQKFEDGSFDVVICAMAIMLIADPYKAVAECHRVTKPGGTFATSTWVIEGWIPDTRDAVSALALPGGRPVCWPRNSAELTNLWGPGCWESPSFVTSMFTAAGFVDVEVEVVTKWVRFSGPDEFCTVFQAFMYGVVERFWTREQKVGLKGELLPAIRRFLERKYQGGPFSVERTVLLARGRKDDM